MTLRKRTLTIISLMFVALIVVLYAASQLIVMGSFAQQEDQDTRQNVQRVQSALADNLVSLEGTTRGWSIWDDTYAYIEDMNETYYKSDLADDAPMTSNRLNLMLFINSSGKTVFVKALDYRKDEKIPVPASLQQYITPGSLLLNHKDADSSVKGILSFPEGAMLIASEPIMHSNAEGDIRGTIIFGRYLDTEEIKRLSKTTLFGLTAYRVDDPAMPSDFHGALSSLNDANPILVQPLSSRSIAGYAILKDVYGKPALVLKAEMPRGVYDRGQETVKYYMLALLVVGIMFGLVIAVLLERLVLSRLARLNRNVNSIGASGNLSARVLVSGSDELSSLANSINGMLAALEHSQHEQKEGQTRYRAVVEQASEGIFLIDADTRRFLEANAACQALLGYSPEEVLELTLYDIIAEDPENIDHSIRYAAIDRRYVVGERQFKRKDGSLVDVEVSSNLIWAGGREVLCMVVRDITDRKRAEEVLRELAMRDGLTGLYNRREMQRILKEEVERYIRYEQPTSLIMTDIDHFKSVNDTYGHQVGDEVLRWVAQFIREMVRSIDKVARYGGEELAVILPECTTADALTLAERLRHAIQARPFSFTQSDEDAEKTVLVPITISLGVAGLPTDADSEDSLIVAADQALYEAKARGRNCTVCYDKVRPTLKVVS